MITASQLYDLINCDHRYWRDINDDPATREEVNPFVRLLWEKGTLYEAEVITKLKLDFIDLRQIPHALREEETLRAMKESKPLIYGGRISHGDLLGEPDLLRFQKGQYIAGDIKSGSGLEGDDDDGKPKKTYAVQLALYTDILEKLGFGGDRLPFIWDIHGREITYDLNEPQGVRNPKTWWSEYQDTIALARSIADNNVSTEAAYSAVCKLCHWYTSCKDQLIKMDDITLLPDIGRSRKKSLQPYFGNCEELATRDLTEFLDGRTKIKSIGPDSLRLFQERAKLRKSGGKPYFKNPVSLPTAPIELFYDIEVDTMRGLCYLHGVYERKSEGASSFHAFMVSDASDEEEERIFKEMIEFLASRPNRVLYFYSSYEKTWWKNLQQKYPHLLTTEAVDNVFNEEQSVDLLYDVAKQMIWPTVDHSLKTLAKHLGFNWRDNNPSGAASVEWFDRWIKSRDAVEKQRIIDYNEDDCRALQVLLDGVRSIICANNGREEKLTK
jgi:predicted RecB family nuclease